MTKEQQMRRLMALKADHYAHIHACGDAARDNTVTAVTLAACMSAGDAVEAACEAFRRAHFPKSLLA